MDYQIEQAIKYHSPFSAIVDINGKGNPRTGRFYLLPDAIGAGHKSIFVRNGTYPPTGIIGTSNLFIMGEGKDTLFDSEDADATAFNIQGATFVTVMNCAFNTNSGSAGTPVPFYMSGGTCDDCTVQGCWVLESSGIGLYVSAGDRCKVINNQVLDADSHGIVVEGNHHIVIGNWVGATGSNSIDFQGNSFYCTGIGNITDAAIADTGTGNQIADNAVY